MGNRDVSMYLTLLLLENNINDHYKARCYMATVNKYVMCIN